MVLENFHSKLRKNLKKNPEIRFMVFLVVLFLMFIPFQNAVDASSATFSPLNFVDCNKNIEIKLISLLCKTNEINCE